MKVLFDVPDHCLSVSALCVLPDGNIKVIRRPHPQPRTLRDIWNNDGPLPYDYFIGELERNGIIDKDNRLYLSGKQIRFLYRFLEQNKIVMSGSDMVDVYHHFAGTFKLKCKNAGSLQRIKDTPQEIAKWQDVFTFLRSDQTQNEMVR